ncbi:phage minor head protein [Clostridium sp. BJN0013]|uniref:phage head morphogenesis protein n=1 Tax=Clostridium sp. BJN0013 TaxID=3236840 RepID=UPI0034C6A639
MSKSDVLLAFSNGLKKAIAKLDTDTNDYFAKVNGNKIWIKDAEQFARDVEKAMMIFFNKQKGNYISKIKSSLKDSEVYEDIEREIESLLFSGDSSNEYINELKDKVQPLIEKYIKELSEKCLKNLAETFKAKIKIQDPDWEYGDKKPSYFDEKLFNKNSAAWVENHVIKFSPEVQRTTHDAVVNAIKEGYEAGETIDELADRLDKLPAFDRNRAIRVARTETIAASNAGEFESYNQSDFVIGKQWLSSHDGRTRPDHAAANGQKKKLDEPFNVGGYKLMFPGDSSLGASAKEVIHCRCTMVPIFQGESLD